MKTKKIYLFCFWILFSSLNFVVKISFAENKQLDLFHQANIAYQKADYATAIRLYSELINSGKVSPEVYFNLGNAYFKSDSLAKAIVNYERAKKISPDDEDLEMNLKIASIRVVDKMDPVPQIFYKRWLRSLAMSIAADSWSTIFLVLIWLSFVSAIIYILSNSVGVKKVSFFLIFTFLLISAASYIVASESHSIADLDKQGIVVASSAYIKSAPGDKGTDLFILHEGAKVDALEEMNGWEKIRTANGSIGWIAVAQLEII